MLFSHGRVVSALMYLTNKVEDYWHILYPLIPIEERNRDKYLYFYDISKKAIAYKGEFSQNGLYLFLGYDGKYHLHPLELAQFSLACWLAWRMENNNIWVDKAIKHCDWLLNNQEKDGSWRIKHKNPKYSDLPDSWPSALAQGLATSSLIRAYRYTNNIQYLNAAKAAIDFLERDVSDSGVKRNFENGFIYEEYPLKKLNGVLNGYISAILGIYELSEYDYEYKKLFIMNIVNLKKIVNRFDIGFYSLYSLDGNISSGFYHRYVITQLKVLEKFDNSFKNIRERFEMYQNNPINIIRAMWAKVK